MRKRKSPLHSFKAAVNDYFSFTSYERKSAFLLLTFLVVLLAGVFLFHFIPPETEKSNTAFYQAIAQYNDLKRRDSIETAKKNLALIADTIKADTVNDLKFEKKLFAFNPNNLPDSMWMQLGLTEKQIGVIKNYEAKGGKFFSKDDVKKMYCITPQNYAQLEPFISIPETKKYFIKDTAQIFAKEKKEIIQTELAPVDLNTATTEELNALPAIGEYRAKSILKYGEMLGGYTDIVQLKEVTGVSDSVYDAIKNFVIIRTKNIRKLNINTLDPMQLRHPYITGSLARIIINYRKMHGDYVSVADIKKLGIVTEDQYKKLTPYLNVQ